MSSSSTPAWSAAHNGLPSDASAITAAGQLNQFLGTHAASVLYQGTPVLTPNGTGASAWAHDLSTTDVDQPFTMSGTTIGRVQIPLIAVGAGADLLVSLCQDNAGHPGTVVTQTRVPASWITQLSTVTAPSVPNSQIPGLAYTEAPLAVAQFNSFIGGAPTLGLAWSVPTASDGTHILNTGATDSNYYIMCSLQSFDNTILQNVFTAAMGPSGVLSPAVPQTPLPVATAGAGSVVQTDPASGSKTLIVLGGYTAINGPAVSTVYAAPFDPTTGTVGSWTAQATLPTAVFGKNVAAWGSYVYVVGGSTTSDSASSIATVQYAQVVNGQITSWSTTTPLPTAGAYPGPVVGNGVLFANVDGDVAYSAPINADGSVGTWTPLPLPAEVYPYFALGSFGIAVIGGGLFQTLSMTTQGLSGIEQKQSITSQISTEFIGVATGSPGQWQVYDLTNYTPGSYLTFPVIQTPMISIPLPVAGLTSGSTYHLLLQQQGGDANDYLRTHDDFNVFPGNPTSLTSPRGQYAWTAGMAGHAVPLQIFDQTPPTAPGTWPIHTWEDSGARVSTLVTASTPDKRVLGVCEATATSSAANQNTGFESGIAPWTVTGGTVAQSQTEVFTGAYSAQVTPSGTAATVYLASELLACMPGQSVTVEARVWFTNAVTSNASVSINWYTLTGTYISTSSNNVSVPAATWTDLADSFTAPANAYQYTVTPTLSGTPAASQVWYVDAARGYPATAGPQLSSVIEINYPSGWPGAIFPATGTTVLA